LNVTFAALAIEDQLLQLLNEKGITVPSAVQAAAILAGRDVFAQSQTGTGKTIAYLLPLLMRVTKEQQQSQVVIIAPTQELALQISKEAEYYSTGSGIHMVTLIGGAALKRQIEKLKRRPQVIVGTPGRIRELIEMRKLRMHTVRTIVVDEMDHILQQSSAHDAEFIIKCTLRDRQLLFFCATLRPEVQVLANHLLKEPMMINIEPEKRVADTITHLSFVVQEREKLDMLRRLIRHWQPQRALVFLNHIAEIEEWKQKLTYAGLSVAALYSDAPKLERASVLHRFRESNVQLLLATDVAAKGLDITDLPYVFSVHPAPNVECYVHRAGRTGRMGRSGVSVQLITERERFIIRKFEQQLGIVIQACTYYQGRVLPVHAKL